MADLVYSDYKEYPNQDQSEK